MAQESANLGITGWRKSRASIKKLKREMRRIQNTKKSTSKKAEKVARDKLILELYRDYIQTLGNIIQQKQLKNQTRHEKRCKVA